MRERVRLNALEHMYAFLAPGVFAALETLERLRGGTAEEARWRRGYLPRARNPTFWFHGASVGESLGSRILADLLAERGHRFAAAYTSANRAGFEYLHRCESGNPLVALSPSDTLASVTRAIERLQPRGIFLVETELWPRLIFEAHRRRVPIFSVAARIYPRDYPWLRVIRPFIARTLRRLTAIVAQNEVEQQRFLSLGAVPERCFSAGNLKYAGPTPSAGKDRELAAELGIQPNERVVALASLHRDEVAMLAKTIDCIVGRGFRVIVAPRHPQGAQLLTHLASLHRWNLVRRSDERMRSDWKILVLDTFGELARFFRIAVCALVGGGFGPHGGHNPFEPVFAGIPVAFGKHFHHFVSEAKALLERTPEALIENAEGAASLLLQWLDSAEQRDTAFERQHAALPDGEAIAESYASIIERALKQP